MLPQQKYLALDLGGGQNFRTNLVCVCVCARTHAFACMGVRIQLSIRRMETAQLASNFFNDSSQTTNIESMGPTRG